MDGNDILGYYKNEYFKDWKHFYRRYYIRPPDRKGARCSYCYVNGKPYFQHIWIAFYIIKRMLQLIIHDMVYENQGFIFTKKDGEPYFWLAVKDKKKGRKYKWKAKFRGHNYGFWQYMFPRFRHVMKGATVGFNFYKQGNKDYAYCALSRLVQNGMDYDEAPIILGDQEIREMRRQDRLREAEKALLTQSAG